MTPRPRLALFALLGANAISLLGNVLASVAIPWFVLATTGSAAKTGIAAFFVTAPLAVGAFFGGTVVDRVGPRRASIVSDVASSLPVAAIPLLHVTGLLAYWHLLALAFLGALFDSPGQAARQALLPELAERAGMPLERANSLYTSTEHAGYVLGAPLAGVLIAALGAANVLWLDAASFALSALAVAVAVPALRPAVKTGQRYVRDLVTGLRFIAGEPVLLMFLLVPAAGNFLISPLAPVILPVYATDVFGEATSLGLMIGAYGAGGLAGTALFGVVGPRVARRPIYVATWAGYAVCIPFLVALPPLAVVVPLLFLIGLTAGALGPLEHTVRQERTPPELRARVFATVMAAQLLVAPPAMLAAGLVIDSVGLRASLVVFAAGNTVLALVALASRPARHIDTKSLSGAQEPLGGGATLGS